MSWEDFAIVLLVIILSFLFVGDPDVWDALRAWAMRPLQSCTCITV
jgi:hypothetical protein